MASKRRGRELAVQVMYQLEFSGYSLPKTLELFWNGVKADTNTRNNVEDLVESVLERHAELDLTIGSYLKNWSLERVAAVDRIILRIGFYELLFTKDVPWRVAVDEAVWLAKMFSDDKSAYFINGVLHAWVTQHHSDITEADREASLDTAQPETEEEDDVALAGADADTDEEEAGT